MSITQLFRLFTSASKAKLAVAVSPTPPPEAAFDPIAEKNISQILELHAKLSALSALKPSDTVNALYGELV